MDYPLIFGPLNFPCIEYLLLFANFAQYFKSWIMLNIFTTLFPTHIRVNPSIITLKIIQFNVIKME
jgi:hypothetical protein